MAVVAYRVHPLAAGDRPAAPLLVLEEEAFADCRIFADELPSGLLIATRVDHGSHQALYDAWRFRRRTSSKTR